MASLISNTTPIDAGITWTSSIEQLTRATAIIGSVFADQPGTFKVEQGGDGVNFDIVNSYAITANTGTSINVPVYDQYFQVSFDNTSATNQTVLRIYINIQDVYGDFLASALAPSAGGTWVVLAQTASGYQYVGRFNGTDGYAVNGSAAIYRNQSGQYASFPVSDAVVTVETIQQTTEHTPASF